MKRSTRSRLSASRPKLPPELMDMVIDHLYNDKVTLANCTLLARSCLNAARMHLFRDVIVFHDRSTEPFGKFVSFLLSHSNLRILIKTLCINGYNLLDRRPGKLDSVLLESVISRLPALDTLLIVNCFWEARNQRQRAGEGFVHRVPLKNLYITYFSAEEESARAKLEILRHFSKVDRLRLDHVWLGHFEIEDDHDNEVDADVHAGLSTSEAAGNGRRPSLQVTSLTLSLADICLNFLAFLWRQPFITTLTSLTIQDLFQAPYLENQEDLTFIGEAIRDIFGSQLTYFEMDLPRLRKNDTPEGFESLNLQACVSLATARLNLVLQSDRKAEAEDPVDESITAEDGSNVSDLFTPSPVGTPGPDTGDTDDDTPGASSSNRPDLPPIPLYTEDEWRTLTVLVNSLPTALKILSISVEFPPTHEGSLTIAETLNWSALRDALGRFTNLEKLVFSKRVNRGGFLIDAEYDANAKRIVRNKLEGLPKVDRILSFKR